MIVRLKKDKEKNIKRLHPWVFSGAIEKAPKGFEANVKVESAKGEVLGRGYYNPSSQIALRMLSFRDEYIDRSFFEKKLRDAFERRMPLLHENNNAVRLVASESDELPGLIVDQYASTVVIQFLTAGMDYYRPVIIDLIKDILKPKTIWDRSDDKVREKEGLQQTSGLLDGEPIEGPIEIIENGYKLFVDIVSGHKTGFYLDQRKSRQIIKEISRDKKVLNCFCYTGGFTVAAALGGAKQIDSVDVSEPALDLLQKSLDANQISVHHNRVKADVFEHLRQLLDKKEKYDLIIMDPPKFVNSKGDLSKASRGYKDINRLAFHLLNPGGLLATFSCSGHMEDMLFQKIIFSAAIDANCNGQIIARFTQAEDHPILLTFPESSYLKGLLVKKLP